MPSRYTFKARIDYSCYDSSWCNDLFSMPSSGSAGSWSDMLFLTID